MDTYGDRVAPVLRSVAELSRSLESRRLRCAPPRPAPRRALPWEARPAHAGRTRRACMSRRLARHADRELAYGRLAAPDCAVHGHRDRRSRDRAGARCGGRV